MVGLQEVRQSRQSAEADVVLPVQGGTAGLRTQEARPETVTTANTSSDFLYWHATYSGLEVLCENHPRVGHRDCNRSEHCELFHPSTGTNRGGDQGGHRGN
jgi:hypothetical protein